MKRHLFSQEEIDKLTTYAGGIVESRQTKERNKKSIEEEKKAAEAQLAALTLAEANGKKGAALRKKILGYTKELEAFNPSSSKKSSIKAGESAEKLAGIQLEQAQKIKRASKRVALENPGSSQAALARISDWLDPLRNPLQGE